MNFKQKQAIKIATERAANEKSGALHDLIIRTHVPSKWRFVDLETGQTWMYIDGIMTLDSESYIAMKANVIYGSRF